MGAAEMDPKQWMSTHCPPAGSTASVIISFVFPALLVLRMEREPRIVKPRVRVQVCPLRASSPPAVEGPRCGRPFDS